MIVFKIIKNFLKSRNLPAYWQEYVLSLKKVDATPLNKVKFVVFDCETSGLDAKTDRILSMGAVTLIDKRMSVNHVFEKYLKQHVFKRESVAIHGLLKDSKNKIKEEESVAIISFLEYLKGAIIVGHHIGFDVACVNYALKRLGLPKLKNKVLDTATLFKSTKHEVYHDVINKHFSLDEVCDELKIGKKDRHTAHGDAFITAIVFLRILGKLNKNKDLKVKDLFLLQRKTIT